MSNTKLTLEQKQLLKNLRVLYPDTEIFHFPDNRVCVGIRRTGERMGDFSVSICADTETKYRKKVGELLVRERFYYGHSLPVVLGNIHSAESDEYVRAILESIADSIAAAVTG
jgi:hypothetical protein